MKKSKGFTLIELLIGLAVIGIAIIAIVGTSRGAADTSKVQTELKNLQSIQQSVKTSFGPSGTYNGLTDAIAISSGAYPTQMMSGGAAVNGWSGAVTTAANTAPAFYDITYNGVPTSSCINLISQVLANFTSIKIGSVSNPVATWTVPLITTECAKSNSNAIVFTGN